MIKPTPEQQQKAVMMVSNTFEQYQELLQPYHNRMLAIYKELNTFTYPKKADWSTTFKVNKMHEVSNKILPRIVSRNPKWLVSFKPDLVNELENWADISKLDMQSRAVQDLLSTIFSKYNLSESTRLWAKGMVNYGTSFAKVATKYTISRKKLKVDEEETIIDENGVEQVIKVTEKIEENVADEYVTIEPVSWSDIYYDPRYVMFQDMPAVVQVLSGVRLADIQKNKEYINVDKLEDIAKLDKTSSQYKEDVQNIMWMTISKVPDVDKNNLSIKTYYWLFELKDWDERLYEIVVANDLVCLCIKEITQIPFEQIRCFEDTETNLAVGFLEPIMGLQQELNYKKNAASEYINHALNRSWVWSPNSGINPKKLINKPNNIIPTNKSVIEAMNNLQELPHRSLEPSYFQEQNDFERQMQGLTFTIDTNNSQNQQWLTNTATGMRIKFYESNVVLDECRKHYEEWLERLGYKLLQQIAENMTKNITIKALDDDTFWDINKEAIVDALEKFEIKIEAGSSSYDTIENRRNDGIAKYNIWQQAMAAWVPVDLELLFKDVLGTFEGVNADKYIKKQAPQVPWMWGGGEMQMPEQVPTWPEQVTEAVAKWALTAGL